MTIFVTGDRSNKSASDDNKFSDLLSALKFAYSLNQRHWNLQTISVMVDPSVTHYVTPSDFESANPLIEEQALINSNYSLIIMPEGCQNYDVLMDCPLRAKVVNRIGSLLKIFMPANGNFIISGIFFDSLDSVLDQRESPKIKDFLNDIDSACSIDEISTLINCTHSSGEILKPKFHKYNRCFTKPLGGGLFHLAINDFSNHYSAIVQPNITIQNCEFRNFHHEMSSLVLLPVDPVYSQTSSFHGYQKPRYSVTMVANIFSGFTSCGSLLSNDIQLQEAIRVQDNVYFSDSDYKNYLTAYYQFGNEYFTERYGLWLKYEEVYFILDTVNIDDIILIEGDEGRMLQQIGGIGWYGGTTPRVWEDDENMEGSPDTMEYFHQFYIADNTFSKFNMLKRRDTDSRLERMEVAVAKVNNKRVAEMGLIIDIEDAMQSSASITIVNNRFQDTQQELGYHNLEGRFQQCQLILSTQADFAQMNILSPDSNLDKYYQLTHIIKVRNITNSKIIIAGNTFFNISVTGPPILLHEQFQSAFNKFIIIKNTFRLIHGFINSNAIQIFRECEETNKTGQLFEDPLLKNDFSKDQRVMIMLSFMGGNILISQNDFSEIAGCPNVAAGAIMLSVGISNEIEEANALGISPEERDDIITDITQPQYTNALMILSVEFAQKCQSELVKYVEIEGEYGTVKLHRQNVRLEGNSYTNVSMGVRRNLIEDNYEVQGALIKIVNIMSTRISNEKFENIGAYTSEHSKDLLSKIFNKPLSYFCDNEKTELYGMINMQQWTYMFDLYNLDFMKVYLSTSLISTHQTYSFMLGPSNTFNNIWLVDKFEALSRSQQLGVLLYMNYHFGNVYLGHKSGQTIVKNIVGMINQFTMERFPFWHPNDFQYSYVPLDFQNPDSLKIRVQEGNMINGASSIIFNLHNPSNYFLEITVCNIKLDKIYHKPLPSYVDLIKIPSILSTVQDSGAFTDFIEKVTLKDITLSNSQFEHSSGYFDLQAKDLKISGFSVYNIGNWRMFDDPEWQRWEESTDNILLATPASIFKLRMFAYDDIQQNFLTLSIVTISDSYFSDIEIYKGALPIFEVDIVKDNRRGFDALLNLNNITLEDSLSSKSDASKIPASSLIKVVNQVETSLSIEMHNVKIQNAQSQYGVIRLFGKINSIKVYSSHFQNVIGLYATVMYIDRQSFSHMSFTDCTFKGVPRKLDIFSLESLSQSDFTEPSMFKIMGSDSIFFTNCAISDYHYAEKAAFMEISQNSQVAIEGCKFRDLSAGRAGAILMFVSGLLEITNSTFERIAAIDGGVFHLSERSEIRISGSRFDNNFALQNGVFKISGESKFIIQDNQFESNQVIISNSIGQVFQVLDTGIFRNNNFIKNKVGLDDGMKSIKSPIGIAIEIVSTSALILFESCLFQDNTSPSGTPNIQLFKTDNVRIIKTVFLNSEAQQHRRNYGGFLNVLSLSNVIVSQSSFTNGAAVQGGAIYIQGEGNVTISETLFLSNSATLSGGAIYADSFSDLIITSNSKFKENRASKSGDSIFTANSLGGVLKISDSHFSSSVSSNFIFADSISEVFFFQSDFSISIQRDDALGKSGGVHLIDIVSFQIMTTKFEQLHGTYTAGGGALIIEQTDVALNSVGLIKDCKFIGSQADTNGGALSILNSYKLEVSNTTFVMNTAKVSGGAIYYTCSTGGNCFVSLNGIEFTKNKADYEGGAIKWTHYEPLMTNIIFNSNQAGIYGDNIASVAKELVKIDEGKVGGKQLRQLISSNQSNSIDNVQSGGSVKLMFALVDKYGTIVSSDNKSKLIIKTDTSAGIQKYVPVLESATEFTAESGIFHVDDLVLISQPNSSQKLIFYTDGIDLSIPDNKAANESKNAIIPSQQNAESSLSLDVSLRECLMGEQMLQNGRCQLCPQGQYLLESHTEPTSCKKCQDLVSECLGGTEIYPLAGYWRSSNDTDLFLACLYPPACIGRSQIENNTQGECAQGYQGILCADCQNGYSKSYDSNRCSHCPNNLENILLIVVFIIIFLAVITILVRSNIQNDSKEKNFLPVFLRIMLNHLQILSLTASFDFDWPEQLINFYKSIQPASDVSTQLLSIDCLLESEEFKNFSSHYRLYQVKAIFIAILPMLLIIGSAVVWLIIFSIKGKITSVPIGKDIPQIDLYPTKKSSEQLSGKLRELAESDQMIIPKFSSDILYKAQSDLFMSPLSGRSSMKKKSSSKFSQSERSQEEILEIHQDNLSPNKGQITSTIIVILFLIHPSITQEMFAIFNCKEIEGVSRLSQDLETVCYDGQHTLVAYWVAIPSIIVYSFGIPLLGIMILFKNRQKLNKENVKQRYGFLYNGYKNGFAQYWEMVIIYRKVILIFIQMFLIQRGKITQALVTTLLLVFSLVLLKYVEPYSKAYLNKLELCSLIISSISVYFGVFFISWKSAIGSSEENIQEWDSSGQILFMFSLIVIAHICFFIYWTNSFLLEFRATIRRRFPRAYLALYLCFKKDNYQFEKEIDEYRYKMRPFVGILMDISKYINEKLELYQKGLVPNEDKELRERVLMLNDFKRRIEKERAFQGDEQTYQKVEEIVKNKRLNYFRGDVVTSAVYTDNIKNSHVHASAHSHLNDSLTSKHSVLLGKQVNNHHLHNQLKLPSDFEQLFEGPFDGATGTGGEQQPDLGSSISKLLNVQQKRNSPRKKRGLRPKNLKSGPLDLYDMKYEDNSKFEWTQEGNNEFPEEREQKAEMKMSGQHAVPVKQNSQRVAPQIIIEEEDVSMDASRFKDSEVQQDYGSELYKTVFFIKYIIQIMKKRVKYFLRNRMYANKSPKILAQEKIVGTIRGVIWTFHKLSRAMIQRRSLKTKNQ